MRRDWTQAEVARLIELRNQKMSLQVIADELDRTLMSIIGKIDKLRGKGIEIYVGIGIDKKIIRKPWTKSDDETIIELAEAGKTWAQIGEELGRTRHACVARFRALKSQGVEAKKKSAEHFYAPVRTITYFIPTYDTRSLTGKICGDPPLSRSALGQKLAARQVEGRAA